MATLYGDNKTKAKLATSAGSYILATGTFAGKVRCMVDKYTIIGTEDDADTVEMGDKLPKGAIVLEQILSCNASIAATATVDVGDSEDPDRYISAVNCAAAIISRIDEPDTGAGYTIDEVDADGATTADSQIILTLNTMTTPVAGSIITLITLYTIE